MIKNVNSEMSLFFLLFFSTGIDLIPKNLTESQLKKVQHLQHVGTLYFFLHNNTSAQTARKLEF